MPDEPFEPIPPEEARVVEEDAVAAAATRYSKNLQW